MNKIVLLGKLIKDPELKTVEGTEKKFTKFIIAVERNFKTTTGERKADLIPIIIWEKKAEAAFKYLKKNSIVSLSGRLQTGSYEDALGNKKYTYEVIAEDFRFLNTNINSNLKEEVSKEG